MTYIGYMSVLVDNTTSAGVVGMVHRLVPPYTYLLYGTTFTRQARQEREKAHAF